MNCPLCQRNSSSHVENQGFEFRRCNACHHVYLNHRAAEDHAESVYGDDYFFGGGAGYDDYLEQKDVVMERGRFYEKKLRAVMAPGRVLDVGSGAGFVAAAFANAGWQAKGLEPNQGMAEFATEVCGVPTACGTMEEFASDEPFDAVVAIQVAAHFSDPHEAFKGCFDALRPGGFLLVETWNCDSLAARLLKSSWHEYSPPSVLHCFSKRSLDSLAQSEGFVPFDQRTTFKKIRAGHAKSLLREKAEHSLMTQIALGAASVIPDRMAIYYPADDLFWSLYQRPEAAVKVEPVASKKISKPQPVACHAQA